MTKTLLICHHDARLDLEVLAPWLSSFSTLVGIVVIREQGREQLLARAKREIKRSGLVGFADVMLFRAFYKALLAKQDAAWESSVIESFQKKYSTAGFDTVPRIEVSSPNSDAAREFIQKHAPDLVIARCKFLLKKSVFGIPKHGTFVMHPGHCPSYRNAHGCFWALVQGEPQKVAMTLLKIDQGIDTGPVYGYFTYPFDSKNESHIRIQARVVLENLDQIKNTLLEIVQGTAKTIATDGNPSAVWGQPKFFSYLRARRHF